MNVGYVRDEYLFLKLQYNIARFMKVEPHENPEQ